MATQFTDNPFLMRQELGDQGINPYGDPLRGYMSFLGQGAQQPMQDALQSYLMNKPGALPGP